MNQIVLGVFNFDPSSLLFRGASGFQAVIAERLVDEHDGGDRIDTHLFSGIKLKPGGAHSLASFDRNGYIC